MQECSTSLPPINYWRRSCSTFERNLRVSSAQRTLFPQQDAWQIIAIDCEKSISGASEVVWSKKLDRSILEMDYPRASFMAWKLHGSCSSLRRLCSHWFNQCCSSSAIFEVHYRTRGIFVWRSELLQSFKHNSRQPNLRVLVGHFWNTLWTSLFLCQHGWQNNG